MCLAIPGRVLEIFDNAGLKTGRVDFGGIKRDVCLECVGECKVGDFVLVHVGFAISLIDEAEAKLTIDLLKASGELEKELAQ